MDSDGLQIDDDREWVSWWIEDEEDWQWQEEWRRSNIPGYREYDGPRGYVEDYITD